MTDWLTQIGPYTVERHEIGRPGGKVFYPLGPEADGIAVLHTTQGGSVSGAVNVLSQNHDAPHFIVGEDRIIQCRPLGVQAAALHAPANQFAALQVECVGFCKTTLWLPEDGTLKPLVALLAYAVKEMGIPLVRPNLAWKDDGSDIKTIWASNNTRRQAGTFPNHKGIYQHLEVTNQGPSFHWDAGALNFTELFAEVQKVLDEDNS